MTDEVIAGRYRLIDPIGTGGSGTVWRAVDLQKQQWCAAKMLRQRDAGELLRFVREQSVRLSHPHIVGPYAWAADDGSVLIAAELVNGGSLQTLLGDYGPFSDGTITVILEQLLQALQAVHEASLIHRDVKPGNILLRATGDGPLDLALTDFGLTISAQDARLTAMGMVIGTPGYLPPELLAGRVSPEPSHDLYAVGRMAITLAVGESRTDHDPSDVFADSVLAAAVASMIASDPTDRPIDAAAALVLLTGAVRDPLPLTRDGDHLVVLDQLPPLPAGREEVLPAGRSLSIIGQPPTLTEPAEPSEPAGLGTIGTIGTPGTTPVDLQAVPTTVMSSTKAAPVSGSSKKWVLPAAGIAALAVVVAFVLVLTNQSEDPTGPTGPPITPSTSGAETVSGTTSVGATSVGTTSVAPPVDAELAAGDQCSWQQEGSQRAGSSGVALICTLNDGQYTWTAG